MHTITFLLTGLLCLAAGYWGYGRYIARKIGLRPDRPTPAHSQADGVDFVAAPKSVLFGHHFASIAGAGPIIGPIVACNFGWLPAMLWVLVGGIFIGAVHDFASLVASLRHEGKSLGAVLEKYVGKDGKILLQVFTLLALILVIGVFTEAVSGVFNAGVADPTKAERAAVVTSTSGAFLLTAVLFGLFIQPRKIPQLVKTAIGLGLLAASMFFGELIPINIDGQYWPWILGGYVVIAAVTPVNILLQPRDFLSSFLLLFLLVGGLLGGLISNTAFQSPAGAIHWEANVLNGDLPAVGLFPFLFIVVACGAISGFHSVVASGTTAKQLDNERDALPVGFGSMLVECLLALLAIAAVMTLSGDAQNGSVMGRFIGGMAGFLGSIGLNPDFAASLVALTVSAFLLTSLDTCTRLARYTLQELMPASAGPLRSALPTTIIVAIAGVSLSLIKGGTAEAPNFCCQNAVAYFWRLKSVISIVGPTGGQCLAKQTGQDRLVYGHSNGLHARNDPDRSVLARHI